MVSDSDLLARVGELARDERQVTAALIAALAEVDSRRLHLGAGCSSLFTYCTQVLLLSEHAAYGRIEAARASRRFPALLERLATGELTLTNVCLLAPVLTDKNQAELLDAAAHKSKRDIEQLIAAVRPLPAVPSTVRKLPAPATTRSSAPEDSAAFSEPSSQPAPTPVPSPPRSELRPLAPERYRVQFTLSSEGVDRLRRVRDLLRHSVPDGDLGEIFSRALSLLLAELEKNKFAETNRPSTVAGTVARTQASRHIPAAVRRAVWRRDDGRCAFVGSLGRCAERGFLEFHHVVPYADGGPATADNIQLRCRAHNQHDTMLWTGAVEEDAHA
jgi:hypothetical protein